MSDLPPGPFPASVTRFAVDDEGGGGGEGGAAVRAVAAGAGLLPTAP